MEAAAAAAASSMAMNNAVFSSASPCHRSAQSSSFFPSPLKQASSKVAIFVAFGSHPRTSRISITTTHCSTKPDADINSSSEHGQHPPANDPNPGTEPQHGASGKSPSFSLSSTSSSPSSSQSLSHIRGLVLDLGPEGSWDSADIGSPVVKRFLSDEEERWLMWYHGRSSKDPTDSIGLAVSRNGAHWERAVTSTEHAGLAMRCSKDWWAFDTTGIWPGEVMVMSSSKVRASSSVYWLYYAGYSSEKVNYSDNSLGIDLRNPERVPGNGTNHDKEHIFRSLPGLAMSQDGRHWARIEGDHHSGALFDVGAENEWDSLFVSGPRVVFHSSGDLRMYYHSFDRETGEFCVGVARSRDGIKWVKLGKALEGRRGCFDEGGAVNAHVVRDRKDGKYLMVYEGVDSNGRRSIGLAVSDDGLREWRRPREEPIFRPSEGKDTWDNNGVGSPYLVRMDGDENEWRLYYRGVGTGGRTGIGMAVSSEPDDLWSFRRWSAFHV